MDPGEVEILRDYMCKAVPVNYVICPEEEVPRPDGDPYFSMEFVCKELYYKLPLTGCICDKSNTITIPISSAISYNRILETTNQMLSAFQIPEFYRGPMLTKILYVARNMLNDNRHKNDKILNMVVRVDVYIYYRVDNNQAPESEEEEHLHQNDHNGSSSSSSSVNDSSIEGLQRVELEQVQGPRHCVICFRHFKAGRKIIRMPCSHFFHRKCILRWLDTKSDCPLCRFQLPTAHH